MKVGDLALNFTLKDEQGNLFELYKNIDQMILLVFYPKDDTPVCSSQLAEYNDNMDLFIDNGIKLVGISADSTISHLEFCAKLGLRFPLLADEDKKVCKQYDAINFLGMVKRLLVLVGSQKKVLWIGSTLSINFIKTKEIIEKTKSIDSKDLT